MEGIKRFVKNNTVALVIIPPLIAFHYGWYRMQSNETFIRKDEMKIEMPIFAILQKLKNKVFGGGDAPK